MEATQEYVNQLKLFLNNHSFRVNGKFYMYDFNHDGVIARNDWIYIDIFANKAYRLMGKEPSENDPFGWQLLEVIPTDLDLDHPSGYFIFIDFPLDTTFLGTNAFSWVYVAHGLTFKLMGADENHNFDYLDEDGDGKADPLKDIEYEMESNVITFFYDRKYYFSKSEVRECSYEGRVDKEDRFGTYEVNAQYRGDIVYECKLSLEDTPAWKLERDRMKVLKLTKAVEGEVVIDGIHFHDISIYDFESGIVHHMGTVEEVPYDCYDYFASPLPTELTTPQEIEKLMEEELEDVCDPSFIKTTCPAWYHRDCTTEEKPKFHSLKGEIYTTWLALDGNEKAHKVDRFEILEIFSR